MCYKHPCQAWAVDNGLVNGFTNGQWFHQAQSFPACRCILLSCLELYPGSDCSSMYVTVYMVFTSPQESLLWSMLSVGFILNCHQLHIVNYVVNDYMGCNFWELT